MTLEEAKKILEKEFAVIGIHKSTEPFEFDDSNWFGYEKPSVLEAFRVLSKEGYYITISGHDYDMRKKRLEKEYEKNTKAPGPGEEHSKEGNLKAATKMFGAQAREIMRLNAENAELRETIDKMKEGNPALEESATQFNDALLDEQVRKIDKQNKEITRLLSLVEKKENSISRLYYEKSVLEKENEELKKGEIPAKYFDKALVDEQAEKIKKLEHEKLDILEIASSCKQTIAELTKEKANLEDQITVLNACKKHNDKIDRKQIKCLGKEIARLNKIIHKKNLKIEELRKESSRHLREKMKMFGENFDLEQELKDKNAILSDVAEELRLSKIREKNLTEVSQKYMKENEELKKELDVAKKQNTAVMVDMTAKCFRAARESINDVFKSYAAKYVKSTLDDLKEKAYESFNAKACNLGLVGSKDGNGIFDQIVGVDNAEEGGDLSGVIVLCGKDFIDAIKKMK
jgi:predicted RNase H-like nuclease (RuvC/YqgF family)